MAAIGGFRSDLSITRKTDRIFGNLSAGSQCLQPELFYGHAMFIAQARDVYLLRFIAVASISEKLSRFKIAAQTSMTFAGKFFTEEIAPNKFQ